MSAEERRKLTMNEKDIKIYTNNSNSYLKYMYDGMYMLQTDANIEKVPSDDRNRTFRMKALIINGYTIYVGKNYRQASVKEIIETEDGEYLIVF